MREILIGFKESFGRLLDDGDADTIKANFGVADNLAAVRQYADAIDTGNVEDLATAGNNLQATLGLSGEQLQSLHKNYVGMSAKEREAFRPSAAAAR